MKDFFIRVATEHQINSVDVGAAGTGVFTWLKLAPEIAGWFTIIWLSIRIYVALRDEVLGKKKGKDDGNK